MFIDTVIAQMREKGYIAKVVPIKHIIGIGDELKALDDRKLLDADILNILKNFYICDYSDITFNVKSVIVTASPCRIAKVFFNYRGKKIPLTIPPTYVEFKSEPIKIESCLQQILAAENYHAQVAYNLPGKIIAAKCGLSLYGKNNICYVNDMGSFALLSTFYSDLPCDNDNWNNARLMECCKTCDACVNRCPTGAISPQSHLIKAERCITYHNEFMNTPDFSEWINSSAHNCIVGCMRCQECCPVNRNYLNRIVEFEEFSEDETKMIMQGTDKSKLSDKTVEKLEMLNLMVYYGKLARNIRVLLEDK